MESGYPLFLMHAIFLRNRKWSTGKQVLANNPADEVNHGSWADSVAPVFDAGQGGGGGDGPRSRRTGVDLIGAPGHTPGNVIVRLEDRGERAYLTGDVIHHPVQVERPEWSSCFCWDAAMSAETSPQDAGHRGR